MSPHGAPLFALMSFQLLLFSAPLCLLLPVRRPVWAYRTAAFLFLLICEAAQDPLRQAAISSGEGVMPLLAGFALTLCELIVAVIIGTKATVWQAFFIGSSAYIVQNLITGCTDCLTRLQNAGAIAPIPYSTCMLISILTVFPLYLAFFVRPIRRNNLAFVSEPQIFLAVVAVIFAVIGMDIGIKQVPLSITGIAPIAALRIGHATLCVFTLFAELKILSARQIATEREVERRMALERERQYKLSRSNIDAINMKCHDIKHQIRQLAERGAIVDPKAVEELADEVKIYDSQVETGNPALDTVLTEKGITCFREGITISAIADGSVLDGFEPQEIYSFFGNALDNAIEAERAIGCKEQRLISVDVHREGLMGVVSIENTCPAEPPFTDGLPQCQKPNAGLEHGFGARSMRQTVEHHAGTLTFTWMDGVFYVNALIPLERP